MSEFSQPKPPSTRVRVTTVRYLRVAAAHTPWCICGALVSLDHATHTDRILNPRTTMCVGGHSRTSVSTGLVQH